MAGPSVQDIICYIMLGIFSVLGTLGNFLVIIVYYKKRTKMVSNLFILILAFVDFSTCLVVVPFTIYMEYVQFHISYDVVCKTYQFLITSNIPFSVLIMVAIAFDRYFCICRPFSGVLNHFRAKVITFILALFSIGLAVIVSLMYGVNQINVDADNSTEQSTSEAGVSYSVHTPDYATTSKDSANVTRARFDQNVSQSTAQRVTLVGLCYTTEIIISADFGWYYQKFYNSVLVLSFVVVVVVYVVIVHSVITRRRNREKQRRSNFHLGENNTMVTAMTPEAGLALPAREPEQETSLHASDGNSGVGDEIEEHVTTRVAPRSNPVQDGRRSDSLLPATDRGKNKSMSFLQKFKPSRGSVPKGNNKQKIAKRERLFLANIRTAAMLFVVTAVFAVTYTPAFLMSLEIIPEQLLVFYMYFANNVANPLIYGFMNKAFRDDLRKLFKRKNSGSRLTQKKSRS